MKKTYVAPTADNNSFAFERGICVPMDPSDTTDMQLGKKRNEEDWEEEEEWEMYIEQTNDNLW